MICDPLPDTRLGDVAPLLDPARVARHLDRRWPDPAQGDIRVRCCTPHGARLDPGRRVTVVHGVAATADGVPFTSFVVADRSVEGTRWRTAGQDPVLTDLGAALGPRPTIEGLCGPDAIRTSVPLRYRPGRRCTLRITTASDRTLFAKFLVDGRRQRAVLESLAALPSPPGFAFPTLGPPVGSPGIVVTRPAGDEPVWTVLTGDATNDDGWQVLARRIGAALAALHGVGLDALPTERRTDLRSVVARDLEVISAHDTPCAESARRLTETVTTAAAPAPGAVCHGSFRFDQIVGSERGELTLLDVDSLCVSEPELDLGNASAYLLWRAVRRPDQQARMAEIRTELLRGYRDAGGIVDDDRLAAHTAASALRIAWRRFANLDRHEWPLVPELLRRAEQLVEWGPAQRRGAETGRNGS